MDENKIVSTGSDIPINVLLADDDVDDRYFFGRVLQGLPIRTELTTVNNGEILMNWLTENAAKLPDLLFLDLNMPKKTGLECLSEIKQSETLKHLPVIIYSTHKHEEQPSILYQKGAHYYIRKTDIIELARILSRFLDLMIENKFARPTEDKFVFTDIA